MEGTVSSKKKKKPKYTVWQNTVYVLRIAFERKKYTPIVMLAQSVLIPAIPAVAMFLPMTVVALILGGASMSSLVLAIALFSIATIFLQTAKSYLSAVSKSQRNAIRHSFIHEVLYVSLSTDYVNIEKQEFTDAQEKAYDATGRYDSAAMQIFYAIENVGANALGLILYTVLLVQVNPLVLALAAATTIAGFFVRRKANEWRHKNDKERSGYQKRIRYVSQIGSDTSLAKDIRLFAMYDWLRDTYETFTKMAYNWTKRMEKRQYIADVVDCTATLLREGAAYAYLIWLVLFNNLPVEEFVLLFAAIGGFSGWILGILNEYTSLQRHSLDYCRMREFYEFPNEFKREEGEPITAEFEKPYTLEMRNVSFRYPGADEDTLKNINLTIKAGEKLAVVGLNGAGKTTIVKLLCGFYDPTEGEVLLNDQDIRIYNREQYYTLFMAVFQDFSILPFTIAENVAQQAREELDVERVRYCIETANIAKKVDSLPGGMNSLLLKQFNDEAVELSGGETQRLMLARALYKDAPVLILDEPTAALDPIAESNLYSRYNELSAGKTSIYISHRLASTRFCDRVILIDEKVIAESGTHDELLEAGNKYAELFELQSKYYQEEVVLNGNG